MRFVFPVLFSVMIAMLFVSFYARLPPPLPFSTSESDLPKPSRPSPLQVLSAPTAPAPDVTPEPALAAIAATPAPAPDVTPESALAAAPKAQLAPEVLPKVKPAAGPARAEAPPEKKRVTATGPAGAAGAITGTELARPRDRDFGQAAGEMPPDQSALKAEVTGGSAMNQPMQPIPPASDTLPATNAALISVPQSATPAPNHPAVQLDSDEMTRLIKRGKDFLAQGNFASARLLFKRAADAGSAEAALALGSTYDPSVIKQFGAVSITPDIDGALKWYETAANHGSAEAAGLFANLMRLRQNQR